MTAEDMRELEAHKAHLVQLFKLAQEPLGSDYPLWGDCAYAHNCMDGRVAAHGRL